MEFPTKLFKHITFTTEAPSEYHYSFETGIFHSLTHLNLQGKNFLSYYILHDQKKQIIGHIYFHIIQGRAVSPLKASYGGMECDSTLDQRIIWSFIDYVEKELKKNNLKEVTHIYPPLHYDLNSYSKITEALVKKDYKITTWETGACMVVNQSDYRVHLAVNQIKKLNKTKGLNLTEDQPDFSHIQKVYEFIAGRRKEKRHSLSMSLDLLKKTVSALPEAYKLFTLNDNDKLVAASVAIQIKSQILYNFYAAHHPDYDKQSPVILLNDFMYRYCQKNNIAILDQGTSSLGGMPNFPLLHFKEHAGAILSPKLGFTKSLS